MSKTGSIIVVIIIVIIIAVIINVVNQVQTNNEAKRMTNDVNYCRNVGAQYGKQGSREFSQAYNACLDGKGWQ